MKPEVYYILHVVAGFLLVGWTLQACGDPNPAKKRKTAILTGLATVVMLIAGFGLVAKQKIEWPFPLWLNVKLGCWLVLSVLPVFVYRKPGLAKLFSLLAILVMATAVAMVYLKPL